MYKPSDILRSEFAGRYLLRFINQSVYTYSDIYGLTYDLTWLKKHIQMSLKSLKISKRSKHQLRYPYR